MSDEKRAADRIEDVVGITQEAAELAEHIQDTAPRHKREELFEQLVEMIDDAHEEALTVSVGWDDD